MATEGRSLAQKMVVQFKNKHEVRSASLEHLPGVDTHGGVGVGGGNKRLKGNYQQHQY